MMVKSKWLVLGVATIVTIFGTGCEKLKSRDEMNKGAQAYKNTKYNDAINHFKDAVQLDPTNENAQLYLAMSYMTSWVPGADTPENNRMVTAAKQEFQKVLDKTPNNSIALASMASMAYNSASVGTPEQKAAALEEARKWNQRRVEAFPNESEAYYSLGVIAWADAYTKIQTARGNAKMKPEDPGPIKDEKIRADMKDKFGKTIDDGMASLQKAIDIDKENDDAMTYMNLLLRKKADLEDSPEAAKADVAKAEDFANRSLELKKQKAARPKDKQATS